MLRHFVRSLREVTHRDAPTMLTGIYVHVPFCLQRCTYCDFNTYTGLLSLKEAYVDALLREMALRAERAAGVRARTLYFGGGTPSLLALDDIVALVQAVRQQFDLPWDAEVTLEANPGTVNEAYLGQARIAGVNRLSLGVQSSHSQELVLLGRIHTWSDTEAAYRMARAAGFERVNFDLMYGLPGQCLREWLVTVRRCLELGPDHLSLYALALEPGTPLAETLALNEVPLPDPDLAADMYEAASEQLHAAGFWQYEISNWARGTTAPPSIWALPPEGLTEQIGPQISQHNLIYWRNEPWIGLGAGAHSWFRGRRWRNLPHPESYINAITSNRLRGFSAEALSQRLIWGETLMMGLRLAEGVTNGRFSATFDMHLRDLYGDVIDTFHRLGLLIWEDGRVRLTPRGRLLGNQVFEAFLPEGDEFD